MAKVTYWICHRFGKMHNMWFAVAAVATFLPVILQFHELYSMTSVTLNKYVGQGHSRVDMSSILYMLYLVILKIGKGPVNIYNSIYMVKATNTHITSKSKNKVIYFLLYGMVFICLHLRERYLCIVAI